MKNTKKGPFDISIDLEQIPGFKARFGSVDPRGGVIKFEQESVSTEAARDTSKDLRAKLGSGQNRFTLPSVILRRKGVRV